jgi:hypothetical protein
MLQLGSLVGCTTTLNGQVVDKGLILVCGAHKQKISNTYRLIFSLIGSFLKEQNLFLIFSGGSTFYRMGLLKLENTNQTLQFAQTTSKEKTGNAIKVNSFFTACLCCNTFNPTAAEDETS